MPTEDFIRELFYRVDETLKGAPNHSPASLWPSEIVRLGVLFARQGTGNRAFYRWVSRHWRGGCPRLPERTRRVRLLATPRQWTDAFLAAPSGLGVVES